MNAGGGWAAGMLRGLIVDANFANAGDAGPSPGAKRRSPLGMVLQVTWRLIVGAVLIGVAAGLAGWFYARRSVDRRLADAIAAADRDDPYWRIGDLMAHREAVPNEENSAVVVARAVSMVPESWPREPPPPAGLPQPPPTAAMRAYDASNAAPANRRLDKEDADTLRGELEKHKEAVKVARTVADFARGRHELRLGPTLIDTPLGETERARTVARLLTADVAIRAHDGDVDGALDSCRTIFGVGRSIGDEPFLISALVRIGISELALQSVRRALAQGEPSDQALSRLQKAVILELDQRLLLYGVKGERAVNAEIIRRIRDGEMPISALGGGGAPYDPGATRWDGPVGQAHV